MTPEIFIDGDPVVPSFRVARGETKLVFDNFDGGLYQLMHPYDIAQKLAEAGNIKQAFAALNGFIQKKIDLDADAAINRIHNMYRQPGGWD